MFPEGTIDGVLIRPLRRLADARGWLVELYRHDELQPVQYPVMAYVSQTLPGVARGPHEHRQQTDQFGFVGPGDFKLYLWDTRPDSPTLDTRQTLIAGESSPQAVIVPPGVIHAYKNISPVPGLVFNCPNRLYAGEGRRGLVDEIRHEDLPDTPYMLD
jgi:dTDP-4-dehydrorhamnose 3,5-epimerase